MKKQYFNNKLAFTLLEVLVVIGIISILVSMISVSYSQSQKKARDVKRKSDLKALQSCMEQAFSVNNTYPNVINSPSPSEVGVVEADCDANGRYTDSVDLKIVDPLNSGIYLYNISKPQYTVSVPLEATNGSTSFTVNNLQ